MVIEQNISQSYGFKKHWWKWLLAALLISVLTGVGSLVLGMDNNWDLLNYHYYNPYAFINGRLDKDIAPAQLQTYLNPIPDLPFYWMARNLTARAVGFILGFIHGINLTLVLLILWVLVRNISWKIMLALSLLVIALDYFSPSFLSELGTTFNDNLVSIFIFAGLLILFIRVDSFGIPQKWKVNSILIFLAGILLGLSVGFKLTPFIFVISAGAAILFAAGSWRERLIYLALFGTGALAGSLISGGYWWWEMWVRFRNPLFPNYNTIFKSPYIVPRGIVPFDRYLPSFWESLVWPLIITRDSSRVSEVKFFDLRLLVVFILLITCAILYFVRRRDLPFPGDIFNERPAKFLLVFFLLSFVLWMAVFSVYRYVLVIELLIPLVLLFVIAWVFKSNETRAVVMIVLSVMILALLKPPDYLRLKWTDRYFEPISSSLSLPENSLVVLVGSTPIAFAIPDMPPGPSYIRMDGNLPISEGGLLDDQFNETIKNHDGPIFLLLNSYDTQLLNVKYLKKIGLAVPQNNCKTIEDVHSVGLLLCKTSRKAKTAGSQ